MRRFVRTFARVRSVGTGGLRKGGLGAGRQIIRRDLAVQACALGALLTSSTAVGGAKFALMIGCCNLDDDGT